MFRNLVLLLCLSVSVLGQLDSIYCGKQTCFDVLGVSRDADTLTIQRAYRLLAKKYHPDRHDFENKPQADAKFREIATAYEILRDPEQRQEYEYMLDNPDQMYYHYYRYYKRRYSPKVDVRIVCVLLVLVLSTIQYISQRTKHSQALSYLVRDPKYRNQAKEKAIATKRFHIERQKFGRRLNRDEIKAHEEEVIRTIIAENFDVRGDCGPPSVRNTLVVQLIFLPYYIITYAYWALRWILLFKILGRPYGPEEKEYITSWRLGFNQKRWESLDEEKKAYFNGLDLWNNEKFKVYTERKAEEARIRLAEDTNQKRYRRYMKRNGPPTVDLEDL
nr:DnaJ domain containing protein [Hymenolepis microstoma]